MSDLIRREELLKQIETDSKGHEGQYGDEWLFIDTINSIPTAEPKVGEWIPCEERLPNETEADYLICTDSGYMCSCRWTNANPFWTDLTTDWHWNFADIPQNSEVVAWMPLKPYEMERSE